jgi:rhodanese-related sulfurtransferase
VCAAAIGKIDGMIFVLGSFIGVFIFAEGYPWFEDFYKSGFWGYPRMFETLHMSQSLFAFLLTFMAVAAFAVTSMIENKVNGRQNPELQPMRLYIGLAGIAVVLGLSAFLMPDRKTEITSTSSDKEVMNEFKPEEMSVDEFAFRIMDGDKTLQIIDFRTAEKYKEMNLPNSINLTYDNLFGKDADKTLSTSRRKYIIIADDEVSEKRAAYIASELGHKDVMILSGGLNRFKEEILNFQKPEKINTRQEADTFRFREKASKIIPEIIQANKKKGNTDKKETKRVLGGC